MQAHERQLKGLPILPKRVRLCSVYEATSVAHLACACPPFARKAMSMHNDDQTPSRDQQPPASGFPDTARNGLPAPTLRTAIAEAVHDAITAYTQDDGVGHCVLYAYVGAHVASRVMRRLYLPLAGSLRLMLSNDGAGWMLDARHGGLHRQEFHAWFACEHTDGRLEVVDLAARHYQTLLKRSRALDGQPKPTWQRAEAPRYLWAFDTDFPRWVQLRALEETTMEVARALAPGIEDIVTIATAAQRRLRP